MSTSRKYFVAGIGLACSLAMQLAVAGGIPRYVPPAANPVGGNNAAPEQGYHFAVDPFTQKYSVAYPLRCPGGKEKLATPDGRNYALYMTNAMQQELDLRRLYYPASGIHVGGSVDVLVLERKTDKPDEGVWKMTVTMTATGIKPVVLEEDFPFNVKDSNAADFCDAAARNFPTAVSETLNAYIQQYL